MEYIRFGSTGMKVSRLCLGCMGFGDAERGIWDGSIGCELEEDI
jgi:aryl-alcohol dehydrogenase-like predicted oxidoreductase